MPDPSMDIPKGFWESMRNWETAQGAPVRDFAAFPTLGKYLDDVWIFPRERLPYLHPGLPWVWFEESGGEYTTDWMVQTAIERIQAKIAKYENDDTRIRHSLGEFDLVCFYCDEAVLYNTPPHSVGFGFPETAANVERALRGAPKVFDRIYLFDPYVGAVQVYSAI